MGTRAQPIIYVVMGRRHVSRPSGMRSLPTLLEHRICCETLQGEFRPRTAPCGSSPRDGYFNRTHRVRQGQDSAEASSEMEVVPDASGTTRPAG